VFPLTWFTVTRWNSLKKKNQPEDQLIEKNEELLEPLLTH
jgi:hypothetical protein